MHKKIYGYSQTAICPFCGKQATTKNWQKVPVCRDHESEDLPDMKCICGEYLDVKSGKYGTYFNCMKCGNVSFNKGLEYNGYENGLITNNPEEVKKAEEIQRRASDKPLDKKESDTDSINDVFRYRFMKEEFKD